MAAEESGDGFCINNRPGDLNLGLSLGILRIVSYSQSEVIPFCQCISSSSPLSFAHSFPCS